MKPCGNYGSKLFHVDEAGNYVCRSCGNVRVNTGGVKRV